MAIFHLSAGAVSRGQGHSAVAASAYRARCELEDERTGETHDYSRAKGLLFEGVYAPANAPAWARDRAQLWNHAEAAETRKNARPARDITLALPHELTTEQNRRLLQDFVREQFVRKGLAADVAIHAPHHHGDERNVHAHVLIATRLFEGDGFAKGKLRELNDKGQLQDWREAWDKLANRHLERAGHAARIDHRSLAEQGIDREATMHLGKHAAALERDGISTAMGDHNRSAQAVQHERLIDALDLDRQGVQGGRSELDYTPGRELQREAAQEARGEAEAVRAADHAATADDRTHGLEKDRGQASRSERAEKALADRHSRAKAGDTDKAIGRAGDMVEKGIGKAAGGALGIIGGLLGAVAGAVEGATRSPAAKPSTPQKDRSRSRVEEYEAKARAKAAEAAKQPDRDKDRDRGRSRFEAMLRPAMRFLGAAVPDQYSVAWAIQARQRLMSYAAETGEFVLTELEHLNKVISGSYLMLGLTLTGKQRMDGGPA